MDGTKGAIAEPSNILYCSSSSLQLQLIFITIANYVFILKTHLEMCMVYHQCLTNLHLQFVFSNSPFANKKGREKGGMYLKYYH